MKYLYLACTPLQILNATEARDRFHGDDENFLVVTQSPRTQTKRRLEFNQMLESLIDDRWSNVWNLKLGRITQLFFSITGRSIQNAVGNCDAIYTGGFQTQLRHLINTVPHEKLVVLDGGAGCSSSALSRQEENPTKLYRLIPGMRVDFPSLDDASFFTSYDLDVDPERIIHNDYRMLQQRVRDGVPIRNEIVFISQPLERDLGVRINTDRLLQHAMQLYGVNSYRNILHPRMPRTDVRSEHLPYLIELFAMREGYLPKAFVTYMSSAARNIQLLYDCPVTCYDILPLLPESTPGLLRKELVEVYNDFDSSGMRVIPVPADCVPGYRPDVLRRAA